MYLRWIINLNLNKGNQYDHNFFLKMYIIVRGAMRLSMTNVHVSSTTVLSAGAKDNKQNGNG